MLKIKLTNNEGEYAQGQSRLPATERSFLQSYGYGQMQARLGNEPMYLLAEEEDGTIRASFLAILFKARRGRYFFLPYAVITSEIWPLLLDFLRAMASTLKVDFIRISPLLDDSASNKKFFTENGFRDAPVHMMHPEILWVLDLSKTEKVLLKEMRKNTRHAIKQATLGGLEIVSGNSPELLEEFYRLHSETARRQHFVPYPREYLNAQLETFGRADQLKVYLARHEGKYIAGAVIMFYGHEGVYHHGASLAEYAKIPASHLIQWEAIREAQRRGLAHYNFWGIVENAPRHPWAGLSFFKQGFGGQSRRLLHCQDLPLTKKYWFNYAVETVRRIKRGY